MATTATILACALNLLTRGPNFPPVVLVSTAPLHASPGTAAFVVDGKSTIYLVTSSGPFRRAEEMEQRTGGRCVNSDALKVVASMIAHEEWHLLHPNDEKGAYLAQLTTLNRLGLPPTSIEAYAIRRAMAFALARNRLADQSLRGTMAEVWSVQASTK